MCLCFVVRAHMCVFAYVYVCTCLHVCLLDAQPTEGEREVWNQVNSVLQDSENILFGLQAYKGAGQEIRDVRHTKNSSAPMHKHCTCFAIGKFKKKKTEQ